MSKGFDELLTFPTTFIFRIIASNEPSFQEQYKQALLSVFAKIEHMEALPSKSGKFSRIHVTVRAENAQQIYSGYDVLKTCEGIRMVF